MQPQPQSFISPFRGLGLSKLLPLTIMRSVLRFLKYFYYLLVLLISTFLAMYLTGRTERVYKVAAQGEQVQIAGKSISIDSLATQYAPEMYLRPNTSTPPLKWSWYEVIPTDSTCTITY